MVRFPPIVARVLNHDQLAPWLAMFQAFGACSRNPRREADVGSQLLPGPQTLAHRPVEAGCLSQMVALYWQLRSSFAPMVWTSFHFIQIIKEHKDVPAFHGRNTVNSTSNSAHYSVCFSPLVRLSRFAGPRYRSRVVVGGHGAGGVWGVRIVVDVDALNAPCPDDRNRGEDDGRLNALTPHAPHKRER